MIPHAKYLNDETTRPFAERTGTMTMWMGDDRRIIMYPCSNNTVMNFVAIHPSSITSGANKGSGKSLRHLENERKADMNRLGTGRQQGASS